MKKLFCLLITLFGCLAQEAGGVRFQFGNRDIVPVPQSVVDQSSYIRDLVREVGANEALLLPEEFGKADLQNIIDYLDIPNVPEQNEFVINLSKSRNKNKFHNFLKLVDYLMLNETLGFHIFDTETIKELSHLGFANEIFASSLRELVRKKPKAACELYSSLEDGNQIKDLLADMFPLWNLSARLGEIEMHNPDFGIFGTRSVKSVALSADGKTIVSGSVDRTVIVWQKNDATGQWQSISRLGQADNKDPEVGHIEDISSVALSADGKTIVSGSVDGTVIVWQKDDATGQWLLISRLGKVVNQDTEGGYYDYIFNSDPEVGHIGDITSVVLSADGKTIVSGSGDKTLIVWQKDDATEQWQLQQRLGVLDPRRLQQRLESLDPNLEAGHVDYVMAVALSSDGKTIVSGSWDERLIVWEKDEFGVWQIKQILGQVDNQDLEAGHVHHVTSVALSSDGKTMVSGSDDETVIVWQKDDFGQWSIKQRLLSPGGPNRLIRNRIITGGGSWTEPGEGKVKSVNISEDGKTIGAGFEGGSVWVWRQDDAGDWFFRQNLGGELILELYIMMEDSFHTRSAISPISDDYHRGQVNSVALNNDGEMIVSGSGDCTVIVWEKKSMQDYCAKLFEASEATALVETPKKDKASKLKRLFNYILKRVRGDRSATR